jgi:hypothetical protein
MEETMKNIDIQTKKQELQEEGWREVMRIDGFQQDKVKAVPVWISLSQSSDMEKYLLLLEYDDGSGFIFGTNL